MSAWSRCIQLICSALLCALVISCEGPPVSVVAPVPAAAPAPQGGLQEAAPPPPVQAAPAPLAPDAVSPPAPRAAPAPAPVAAPPPVPAKPPVAAVPPAPPARRGGAPPETELVTLPGGQIPLEDWLSAMDSACQDAHYQTGCLNLIKNFSPKNGPHPADQCKVKSQSPGIGKHVTTSTPVTLNIKCPQPDGSGASGNHNDPNNPSGP